MRALTVALIVAASPAYGGVDDRLALSGDRVSFNGQFLATVGVVLEFDGRVMADGSLDIVVTHDLDEVVSATTEGKALVTSLGGVRVNEAAMSPELERKMRQMLDSKVWAAYRELVLVLKEKISREPAHAKLVLALSEMVESGDRLRMGQRVSALARIPTK